MRTVSFCGQTCHTVMQPEFTAYQSSPHSRVECVSCHIGGGNHGAGIHGTHLGPGVHIRYAHSDESRQTIPSIEYSDNAGRRTAYVAPDAKPDGAGLRIPGDGLYGLPQPAVAFLRIA